MNRKLLIQKIKSIFVPGTCFKIKMRQSNSRDHNGKVYRYFTVLQNYDDMFLCQGEGKFRESFTAWDLYHMAELIEEREEDVGNEGKIG